MNIKLDWSISFDDERFMALQGESFARLLNNPGRLDTYREAVSQIKKVIRPAACWERFAVKKMLHEKVVLADGTRIGGGPVVTVVGGAEALIAAVCTVGFGADRLIEEAQKGRQLFKAMLLSDLAAWGVDMLRQELCWWLEEDAHRQGLRVSTPLSPGESAWSVEDQAVIFSLLDAGQIGVSLSASLMMTPIKSLSLIMGIGSQPLGVEGASNCDFCSIKERCSYQSLRPHAQHAPT
jgi:hypothetical protein